MCSLKARAARGRTSSGLAYRVSVVTGQKKSGDLRHEEVTLFARSFPPGIVVISLPEGK